MRSITEIIPDDLPDWAEDGLANGQFFRVCLEMNGRAFHIEFSHEAVDAFWKVWMEIGEPHKHGVYESTWMAFRAAMEAGGKDQRATVQPKQEPK